MKGPKFDAMMSRMQTTASKCAQQTGCAETTECAGISEQLLSLVAEKSATYALFADLRRKPLEFIKSKSTDARLNLFSKMPSDFLARVLATLIARLTQKFDKSDVETFALVCRFLYGIAKADSQHWNLRILSCGVHEAPGNTVQVQGVLNLFELALDACDERQFSLLWAALQACPEFDFSRSKHAFLKEVRDDATWLPGWCLQAKYDLSFCFAANEFLQLEEKRFLRDAELVALAAQIQASKTKVSLRLRAFKMVARGQHLGRMVWARVEACNEKTENLDANCRDAVQLWDDVQKLGDWKSFAFVVQVATGGLPIDAAQEIKKLATMLRDLRGNENPVLAAAHERVAGVVRTSLAVAEALVEANDGEVAVPAVANTFLRGDEPFGDAEAAVGAGDDEDQTGDETDETFYAFTMVLGLALDLVNELDDATSQAPLLSQYKAFADVVLQAMKLQAEGSSLQGRKSHRSWSRGRSCTPVSCRYRSSHRRWWSTPK